MKQSLLSFCFIHLNNDLSVISYYLNEFMNFVDHYMHLFDLYIFCYIWHET